MDEISLAIFIGRRAECFRQKLVASKKGGKLATSGYKKTVLIPREIPTPAVKSRLNFADN